MAFAVFADGSANLPKKFLGNIRLLPCHYTRNNENKVYTGDVDQFDGHSLYEDLRNGTVVKTSLLNTKLFIDQFTPLLKQGLDVVYVSMSSGISGTYNAARLAAQELMEQYKGRFVHIVDSLGCGFGNGILAMEADELSQDGKDARSAAQILDEDVPHICQYFTVDDLNFLKKTGRVSGVTAAIGTILNIKPILFGSASGEIISCGKVRGRKKAIEALIDKFNEKREKLQRQIFISHGDCPEDAETLKSAVSAAAPEAAVTVCQHEPFSGAHVGPGMLGLFFRGKER